MLHYISILLLSIVTGASAVNYVSAWSGCGALEICGCCYWSSDGFDCCGIPCYSNCSGLVAHHYNVSHYDVFWGYFFEDKNTTQYVSLATCGVGYGFGNMHTYLMVDGYDDFHIYECGGNLNYCGDYFDSYQSRWYDTWYDIWPPVGE
jgi:hypothetical protein